MVYLCLWCSSSKAFLEKKLSLARTIKTSFKISALENFAIFTGKRLCLSLFLTLQQRCFPVNISKFLRTAFL